MWTRPTPTGLTRRTPRGGYDRPPGRWPVPDLTPTAALEALQRCVGDGERFGPTMWGRSPTPQDSRGRPGVRRPAVSLEDVDHLIASSGLRLPGLPTRQGRKRRSRSRSYTKTTRTGQHGRPRGRRLGGDLQGVRRRRHHRPPGDASLVGAAGAVLQASRAGVRAPDPGERLHHTPGDRRVLPSTRTSTTCSSCSRTAARTGRCTAGMTARPMRNRSCGPSCGPVTRCTSRVGSRMPPAPRRRPRSTSPSGSSAVTGLSVLREVVEVGRAGAVVRRAAPAALRREPAALHDACVNGSTRSATGPARSTRIDLGGRLRRRFLTERQSVLPGQLRQLLALDSLGDTIRRADGGTPTLCSIAVRRWRAIGAAR